MGYGAIAESLLLHKSTVATFIKHFNETGNISPKPKSGRPRVTTQREDRVILR